MEIKKTNSYLKEYILKCPICYEQFSNEHVPVIIPCGHTICCHCVQNLKKISAEDYEENYSSEVNDEEFDISLDSEDNDKSSNEEDGSENQGENEENEESESESDSDSQEDESGEEESEENEIIVDEQVYPNLIEGKDKFNENYSSKKIKLKCSICRKKMKIFENEIVTNKNIMDVISSIDENTNAEFVAQKKASKVFCKICRCVDFPDNHSNTHSNHSNFLINIDDKFFEKIKAKVKEQVDYNRSNKDTDDYSKNDNVLVSNFFVHKDHKAQEKIIFTNISSEFNNQIIDTVELFLNNLIKSKEFFSNCREYIENYFLANSKATYLKNKSLRKLTKLYGQFNKFLEELELSQEKEKGIKNNSVMKKAENCIYYAEILLEKYLKVTDIYMNNYKNILNVGLDLTVVDKENIHGNHCIDIPNLKNKGSTLTDKIFQEKAMKIFNSGFFESYFNGAFDSERRYAICVDSSSNLIFIFDLRVENELEVEYEKVFSIKEEENKEKLESNYSDYIEIDEEGRLIYILGKRALDSKKFRCYDLRERKLIEKTNVPVKLSYFDKYFYSNKLYILGGATNDETPILSCFYYDTTTDNWKEFQHLSVKRFNKSIALNNNKFYVFGGQVIDNNDYVYKFEVLDVEKINDVNFSWEVFTVKKYNFYVNNSFYGFLAKDLLLILGGEDFVSYEECTKGFLIKFEENLKDSEVVEEIKIKNSVINSHNVCSYFRGIFVGSQHGNGYFTKFNLKKHFNKFKTLI